MAELSADFSTWAMFIYLFQTILWKLVTAVTVFKYLKKKSICPPPYQASEKDFIVFITFGVVFTSFDWFIIFLPTKGVINIQ